MIQNRMKPTILIYYTRNFFKPCDVHLRFDINVFFLTDAKIETTKSRKDKFKRLLVLLRKPVFNITFRVNMTIYNLLNLMLYCSLS